MNIKKLAMTTACAIALASWATPRLAAQAGSSPTHQDPGQQGEHDGDHQDVGPQGEDRAGQEAGQKGEFEGDHEDTGVAAADGKEGPEVGEAPEGKETPEGKAAHEIGGSTSSKELENSSPDTDRVEDSHADSVPE